MAHPMVGLGKWLKREAWREPLGEVVAEHLDRACKDYGVELETLEETIGQEAFIDAWGAACEDFFTRDLEDGRNFADDYLKRRGWKESPANRGFIEALRHSVISLYEVTEVERGRHFTVLDLIRGGEPLRVDEPDRSRHMRVGDLLGARLFRVRQRLRTSEIILVFSPLTAAELRQTLEDLQADAEAEAPAIAAEIGRPDDAAADDDDIAELASFEVVLQGTAPLFTDLWLRQVLADALGRPPGDTATPPLPRMVNSDGEDVEFATAAYELRPGVAEADLAQTLAGLPFIEAAAPPETEAPEAETSAAETPAEPEAENAYEGWTITWHWVDETATPDPAAIAADDAEEPEVDETGALRLNPKSPKGLPALGDLSQRGRALRLVTNSSSRLERGRALLEPALEGLVGAPEVRVRSLLEFLGEVVDLTRNEDGSASDGRND